MVTLKLSVWLLYIAADIWINFIIIERNKKRPRYLLLNIMRGIAFILWAKFVVRFEYDLFYLNYFLFAVTSFWLLFDWGINVSRGKHFFYIGPQSGWIDKWGVSNPGLYFLAKLGALVVLIFSVINIYQP